MKISIITITYNSVNTLEDTIKSIINQNAEKIELEYIVIDGKSTDGTLSIIEKYRTYISKFVSEKDEGISDAFNKGIKMASGDIIGIINSDDMLLPGALQRLCNNYEPQIDVYFGNGKRLQQDGSMKDYTANPNLELLKKAMWLVHPAVFVKREAYEKYGLFGVDLKCIMDRDILLRMYLQGARFKYLNVMMIIYRDGGISNKQYFSRVLPEEEKISIKYGMPPIKAKLIRYKNWVYMHIVFCVKSMKGRK